MTDRLEIAFGRRADLVRVHPHRPSTGPDAGRMMPVVRGVWRAGERVC